MILFHTLSYLIFKLDRLIDIFIMPFTNYLIAGFISMFGMFNAAEELVKSQTNIRHYQRRYSREIMHSTLTCDAYLGTPYPNY